MTTYRLISFKACPWVQRAAIALREKSVEFEFVHIEGGNRPEWFASLSPHGKVPVLQLDGERALFESNAICEFLDDTVAPRLHPEDPIVRAMNRAWTDYIPTYSGLLGAVGSATTEEGVTKARGALAPAFARLEDALARQGSGPFFNGERYALVDAAYAPFLQRYLIVEEIAGDYLSRSYPRLRGWAEALVARPSTHTFPPEEFRTLYLGILRGRGSFIAQQDALVR